MIRNQDWYDGNESQSWPFDDTADLVDRDGQLLPNDIFADLYLRFPAEYGERAFLSTLSIGPRIVAATFLGSGTVFAPLAAVTLPKPVEPGVQYPLTGLVPGVGGWVVFGSGVLTDKVLRFGFQEAHRSLLLAQTARRYGRRPVQTLGKAYVTSSLTGLVRLQGGTDLETRAEERQIDGVLRKVAVIRLRDKSETVTRNLLELYAGPCGRRPESRNCGDPAPIEFLNTVQPDCCGNITLEFRGCAQMQVAGNTCGVILDCGVSLGDSCVTRDRIPDPYGHLPSEFADECETYDEVTDPTAAVVAAASYVYKQHPVGGSKTVSFENYDSADFAIISGEFTLTDGGGFGGGLDSITADALGPGCLLTLTETPSAGLPASLLVRDSPVAAYNVTHTVQRVISGRQVVTSVPFTAVADGGYWEEPAHLGVVWETSQDLLNLALLNQGAFATQTSVWKFAETTFSIRYGATGTADNAGLVFNNKDGGTKFWLAEVRWGPEKTFCLTSYDNGLWRQLVTVPVPGLDQAKRYRLTVRIVPLNEEDETETAAYVQVSLFGLDDGLSSEIGPVPVLNYYPANGHFGLFSHRSLTWFEYLTVGDYSP